MLALIAGTGDLPLAVLARLPERPLICALAGFRPAVTPDLTLRIEHLGSFLADLRSRGITAICMAGAVSRPQIDVDQIDAETAPLVPRITQAIALGDDGALRALIAIVQEAGFEMIAAQDIAPDLLPPAGITGTAPVTHAHRQDAVSAEQVLHDMGRADMGQACIIRGGQVLAREDKAGTDAMLARFAPSDDPVWRTVDSMGALLGSAAEWLSGPDAVPIDAQGAILFKAPKPGQDRRADLPVIGPVTAQRAVAARLDGIVIAAGGVMVLDLDAVRATLTAAGLFLWVRPDGAA